MKIERFLLQQDRGWWTGQGTGADRNSGEFSSQTRQHHLPPSLANLPLRKAALLAQVAQWAMPIHHLELHEFLE